MSKQHDHRRPTGTYHQPPPRAARSTRGFGSESEAGLITLASERQFRVSGWLGVSGWFFVTMLLVDVSYLVWYSYLYSVTADFNSVVEHDFRGLTLGFVASCFGISLVLAWFLPIDIVYMARWCFGLLFVLVSLDAAVYGGSAVWCFAILSALVFLAAWSLYCWLGWIYERIRMRFFVS
jgi:hypothetical protein